MYHRLIEEVTDIEKKYPWLEKAGLRNSTEALIVAPDRTQGIVNAKMPLRQCST